MFLDIIHIVLCVSVFKKNIYPTKNYVVKSIDVDDVVSFNLFYE